MACITHPFIFIVLAQLDLVKLEQELKKRWPYRDIWFRKQNDVWDKYSNFIYNIQEFEALLERIRETVDKHRLNKKHFFYYTVNRWYNFWSACAVEQVFIELDGVDAAKNKKDRLVDFSIQGIKFDLKTSKFPKGFGRDLDFAMSHQQKLIKWLYLNQSTGRRYHIENRLFLIVYSEDGDHYKLKAEIEWLKTHIEEYVETFDISNLKRPHITETKPAYSDIIWAIK